MRTLVPLSAASFLLLSLPLRVNGNTITFASSSTFITYSSEWSQVEEDSFDGGVGEVASTSGASFSFLFDGDQITVVGDGSAATYNVVLDGTTIAGSGTSAQIFKQDQLARGQTHSVTITLVDDGQMLLNELRVGYLTGSNLVPSLVSSPDLTTTPSTTSTTSTTTTTTTTSLPSMTSTSSTSFVTSFLPSSSPSSSALASSVRHSTPLSSPTASSTVGSRFHLSTANPGAIAGGVIGALIGFAALAYLLYLCVVRHRDRRENGYWDSQAGPHGRFVVGGMPVESSKYLSQVAAGTSDLSGAPTNVMRGLADDGGVSVSPPHAPSRQPEWKSRVRHSSWARNMDRLAITRAFYRIAIPPGSMESIPPPEVPPPTTPLPPLPSGASAVGSMVEVNLHRIPASQAVRAQGPSSSTVGPPLITRPQAMTSRSRFSIPPPSSLSQTRPPFEPSPIRPLPSAQLRRRTNSIDNAPKPPPPNPLPLAPNPPKSTKRNSKDQLTYQLSAASASATLSLTQASKKHRARPSYTSQDDYYSHASIPVVEDMTAATVETLDPPDEEEKPKYWHPKDETSRYAGGSDPRISGSRSGTTSSSRMSGSKSQTSISSTLTGVTSGEDFGIHSSEEDHTELLQASRRVR